MNTNNLNRHLENKAKKDVANMVTEIEDILLRYDREYNIRFEDFFLIKIVEDKRSYETNEILFDKSIKRLQFTKLLRSLLKDRYYDKALKKRTEDLLNKVELLD
jgi:hypothetical protein|tara:strand:+ start:41 stop:352 length:312 start_codon:yes stop_codon:yes gene_type:complete